jgi:hypothetical protein
MNTTLEKRLLERKVFDADKRLAEIQSNRLERSACEL